MAFETEFGNLSHPTDVISDALGPALADAVVVAPLVYTETAPLETNVKLFRKAGTLTAQDVAESASHNYASGDEYTETEITATLAKSIVYMKITAEAERFHSNALTKTVAEAGRALARRLDDKVLALFSGFSTQNNDRSGSTLDVETLMEAAYSVYAANAGFGRQLVGVVDFKGALEIKKNVNSAAAAIYSQPERTTLLDGAFAAANGFIGSIPGVDLYATSGLPLASSDDVALVFNPDIAIAGMVDPAVTVWENTVTADGMFKEYAAYIFNTFVEWYDGAGVGVLSAT
jgi:hypothetical protein